MEHQQVSEKKIAGQNNSRKIKKTTIPNHKSTANNPICRRPHMFVS